MSENNTNVPKIRFPGFTDAWEQRYFFDNVKNTIDFRGRTPKKLGLDWSKTGYLALSALNVKNGYIDPGADAYYGNQELYDKWMTGRELRKGQVLFTTEAPMGNVAQVPDDKGYILSQRTIAFDVNSEKITDDFLAVLLRSPKTFAELSALSSGGTAKGVSQKSMSQLKVTVPTNLEEQAKIGAFFKNLDHLITLHQRKLYHLQDEKKSLLQKMFPKNGADVPEIRFPGFTHAWEQRRLEDVVDVRSGRDYKHLSEGDIPVYGTGGYMLSVSEALSYAEDGIGIGRKGTIDKPYLLRAPFWTVDTLFYAVPKEKYDLDFVHSVFQRVNWKQKDESTGVPSLSKTTINEVHVAVSGYEEQAKIGAFFKNLDHLITLHQRKLNHLQEQKKSLLQQMFV